MKRITCLISLWLLFVCHVHAQFTSLYVQHPQQTWRSGTGTIKKAVSSIRPQGAYTRHDLYLTFGADGLGFGASDSVEVTLRFDLPSTAIVTDLWLWVDTAIVQARIYDRWTASRIYENIVNRRRDPALLLKNSATSYELRVYPMIGTGTRRVRLSYLTLNGWNLGGAFHTLPMHILRSSRSPVPSYGVLFWESSLWTRPWIVENDQIGALRRRDSVTNQEFSELTISAANSQPTLTLGFQSALSSGMLVRRYQRGGEGVFELGFLPSQLLNLPTAKKIAVLFDFDPSKSSYTSNQVLAAVRSALLQNLNRRDSINLIFSGATIRRAGPGWFGGDSAGIALAFNSAGPNPISNYSNLPSLLVDGIDFVRGKGGNGVLWLVANTDAYGNYLTANPLITDLLSRMPARVPMHFSDFCNANQTWYYFNGTSYRGNVYLYDNLAQLTMGSSRQIASGSSLSALLQSTATDVPGKIEAFDVITTMASGYCYGRFSPNLRALQPVGLDAPVFQIGKFSGSFPLNINIAGRFRDSTFARNFTVTADQALTADSTAGQIWTGYFLSTLEAEVQTPQIAAQGVALSIESRVLSKYTGFLALEPNDTIRACLTCRDESQLVPVQEQHPGTFALDSLLQAYPNPFNSSMTLRVRLPLATPGGDATLVIYNVVGQKVRELDVSRIPGGGESRVFWDGTNDARSVVGSGIYFATLSGKGFRSSVKLLLMK